MIKISNRSYIIISSIFLFNISYSDILAKHDHNRQIYTSHSYAKSRPIQNYEFIMGPSQIFDHCSNCLSIKLYPCYKKSLCDESFSRVFTIENREFLSIIGDTFPDYKTRSIDPFFLEEKTNYKNYLSLRTESNSKSIRVLLQTPFESIFPVSFLKGLIMGFRTTLSSVNNKIEILFKHENPRNTNIYTFFSQTADNEKINNNWQNETGFESFTISLENLYKSKNENIILYYYTGIEIPTTYSLKSKIPSTLFKPSLGNNGHLGLMAGALFYGFFCNSDTLQYGIFSEFENHFQVYRTQMRTFDLYNKPWSRYLPAINILNPDGIKTISGVTHLPVRIHPCNSFEISLGPFINLTKNNSEIKISLGYSLWHSSDEYSELRYRECYDDYIRLNYYGIKGSSDYTTASKSTIASLAEDDSTSQPLTLNDLDPYSVCALGGNSNTFFARCYLNNNYLMGSLGFWVEKGDSYRIESNYGLWAGFGIMW